MDLITKTADQLKTLVQNHERLGRLKAPLYLAAVAEMTRRNSGELDLERTKEIVVKAAKGSTYISYKDISDRSGAVWARVRHKMPLHLRELCAEGHRQGLPMLSSIVVTKLKVSGGQMEPDMLAAFCKDARDLGVEVGTEAAEETTFLKEQQVAVFAAAKEGRLS